jgi:phage terminase small subunit
MMKGKKYQQTMPAGRPSKTDADKKARGTFKPSRSTGEGIDFNKISTKKKGRPTKVSEYGGKTLGKDAKKMYNDVVHIMQRNGTYTEYANHLILVMCCEYDTYINLVCENPIEHTESGMSAVHASIRVRKIALDNFTKMANALSITPTMLARLRVGKEDNEEGDPMVKFLK